VQALLDKLMPIWDPIYNLLFMHVHYQSIIVLYIHNTCSMHLSYNVLNLLLHLCFAKGKCRTCSMPQKTYTIPASMESRITIHNTTNNNQQTLIILHKNTSKNRKQMPYKIYNRIPITSGSHWSLHRRTHTWYHGNILRSAYTAHPNLLAARKT
jgi:hypothetical protein